MANNDIQLENGYTKIANDLLEKMSKVKISGSSWQVLLAIIRMLYGFNKNEGWIKISQLSDLCCLSKPRVSEAIKQLRIYGIVTQKRIGTRQIIGINKKFTIVTDLRNSYGFQNNCSVKPERIVTDLRNCINIKKTIKENILNKINILWDAEKKDFSGITTEDIKGWSEAYPAVKIHEEIKKAREWVRANPKLIKKNWNRFFVNWFSRAQDRGGNYGGSYEASQRSFRNRSATPGIDDLPLELQESIRRTQEKEQEWLQKHSAGKSPHSENTKDG